jgi:hypothetical protein
VLSSTPHVDKLLENVVIRSEMYGTWLPAVASKIAGGLSSSTKVYNDEALSADVQHVK